jgi:acyl carrier protein
VPHSIACKKGEKMEFPREEIFLGVREIIAEVTNIHADEISENSTCFVELGIESFDLTDINYRLEQTFKIDISSEKFWNIADIMQNPEYFTEDNMLTAEGVNEVTKRLPGLELTDDLDENDQCELNAVFERLTVAHIVNFIQFSLINQDVGECNVV